MIVLQYYFYFARKLFFEKNEKIFSGARKMRDLADIFFLGYFFLGICVHCSFLFAD